MQNATAEERRRSERCSIDFFVQEISDGKTFLHPAIDLSADGIYVLARDQRKAVDGEEELNLEFTLPNGDTVKTRGQVVHVDDHGEQRGMRIAFRHMTAQMRDTIDTFVKRTLSESQSG